MKKNYFVFREAQSLSELESLLRLRYEVYRTSRLQQFVPENEYGIDFDCYDLRARHFGLFMNDIEPVGYHRPVSNAYGPLCDEILRLAAQFPGMSEKVRSKPEQPLPIMTYWPEAHILKELHNEIKGQRKSLAEATKFTLDPSMASVKLATHIIESGP